LGDYHDEKIRTLFLQMCVRAESMVRLSVRSVLERDSALGRSVVGSDREIDRLEVEIDRRCMIALARGADTLQVRMLSTIMKMVTDLERIGDLSVNIAERGLDLSKGTGMEAGEPLRKMAQLASSMIAGAAEAFIARDAQAATRLISWDQEIDALNRDNFERLLGLMSAHPAQVDRALALTSISKHLERVGDHAVNLCEMVVFLVEGTDLRHGGIVDA